MPEDHGGTHGPHWDRQHPDGAYTPSLFTKMMIYKNRNLFRTKHLFSYNPLDLALYLSKSNKIHEWKGISIQIKDGFFESLTKDEILKFKSFFSLIIENYNQTDTWFIQPLHPFKLFNWFINKNEYKELELLNDILIDGNNFKGYIAISNAQISSIFEELFLFPKITKSQDLLLFNEMNPIIIKFSQHLCLDIISTNESIIDQYILKAKTSDFVVKRYV